MKLKFSEIVILFFLLLFFLIGIPYYKNIADIFSFTVGGGISSFLIAKFVVQKQINNTIKEYLTPYEDKDYEFYKKVAEIFEGLEQNSKHFSYGKIEKARIELMQAYDSIFKKTNKSK